MTTPLILDRIPFLLMERCKIKVLGNSLIAERKDKSQDIPVRSLHLLLIGNGVSITSEAMALCSKNNCYIAQCKGGSNIHTVHHAGMYKNPKKLINQVIKSQDSVKRLETAKHILMPKVIFTEQLTGLLLVSKIKDAKTVGELLGIEGYITKLMYHSILGKDFKRDFKTGINKTMNIANSIIYNFIASLVVCMGYSPSIGFVHGHTRRGALVFDLADMFKHSIYLKDLLSVGEENITRYIFTKITANNNRIVREIITEIETVCS